MKTRRYTKQRRAEAEEMTREKILEAVMSLHEEVGPSRTTISAIAGRAGVERLTVYRHFPDEAAIIRSCSALWSERNPAPALPKPDGRDALDSCRRTLLDLYRWYRRNQRMLTRVEADRNEMETVRAALEPRNAYLDEFADALDRHWPHRNAQRRGTLRHAVEFSTWQSLERIAKGDRPAVAIVIGWLRAVTQERPAPLKSRA